MIRQNGVLIEATWEAALQLTAQRLLDIKAQSGPHAVGGLISGRLTNEELYLFQKLLRLAVGTNNVDSSARYGHLNAVRAMQRVQGTHRWTLAFEDIVRADVILLIGTNLTDANPITGLKVKEAVKKHQAELVTIESMQPAIDTISNIANLSRHHLCMGPEQFPAAVLGLLKAAVEGNHIDAALRAQAPDYVTALSQHLGQLAWTEVAARTGASQQQFVEIVTALARGRRVVVLAGQGLLRSPGGYHASLNLLDLLLLLGKAAAPGCGFAPLAEENNDQGAVEMGAVAEWLPGALDVSDETARKRIAQVWKGTPPDQPGATLIEMIEQAGAGRLKAMLIVGENPVASLPAHLGVKDKLAKLDFLLCQELFLTETASLAHVVLPAASAFEKAGTFTNSEGHAQAVRPAIEPVGESRPDWDIFSALSILLGTPWEYADAKDLLKEIRSIVPGYGPLGPTPVSAKVDQQALGRYLAGGFVGTLPTGILCPSQRAGRPVC